MTKNTAFGLLQRHQRKFIRNPKSGNHI